MAYIMRLNDDTRMRAMGLDCCEIECVIEMVETACRLTISADSAAGHSGTCMPSIPQKLPAACHCISTTTKDTQHSHKKSTTT